MKDLWKDLGTDPIVECPCCQEDVFELKRSNFEDGDRYIAIWQCSCGAEWLEEYILAGAVLLSESRRGDV